MCEASSRTLYYNIYMGFRRDRASIARNDTKHPYQNVSLACPTFKLICDHILSL